MITLGKIITTVKGERAMSRKGDLVRFVGSEEEYHELKHGAVGRIACDWAEGHPNLYNLEGYCACVAKHGLELAQTTAEPHVCACGTCTCFPSAA